MPTCSVCGQDEEHLIHTCNHCGKKHCSEHQLPENHICIPSKSDLTDEPSKTGRSWSSQKHKRKNVMADKRRSRRNDDDSTGIGPSNRDGPIDLNNHGPGSSDDESDESCSGNSPDDGEAKRRRAREEMDQRLSNNTDTKRRLEDNEIDADSESSPAKWVEDVKRNREALNERLAERHREWEEESSSRTISEEKTTSTPSTESKGGAHIPRALLIVFLLVALSVGYLLLGTM